MDATYQSLVRAARWLHEHTEDHLVERWDLALTGRDCQTCLARVHAIAGLLALESASEAAHG